MAGIWKLAAACGRAVARSLPDMVRDIAGLAGAALIAYGWWLIYPPAGYIAGGVLLLAAAFLSASGKRHNTGSR